jgi:hypothetical protein
MTCGCQNSQPAATPGACDAPDAFAIFLVAAVGAALATVVMVNVTGETSVRGLSRKTGQYARGFVGTKK